MKTLPDPAICPWSKSCSGCEHWDLPIEIQRQRKFDRLMDLFAQSDLKFPAKWDWVDLPSSRLRDRFDFQVRPEATGLFKKDKSGVEDLNDCWLLQPSLAAYYHDFRQIKWGIQKGSVRLRIGQEGRKGAWLDFPNEDVARLFATQDELRHLASLGSVEIGQRRKALIITPNGLKLSKEPHFDKWTETWVPTDPIGLYSRIGDFSQSGRLANFQIVKALLEILPKNLRLAEFGSGFGNLTLPLAAVSRSIDAFEVEPASTQALSKNLEGLEENIRDRVRIFTGDFQRKGPDDADYDAFVVNPPRSGLGKFLWGQNLSGKILVYLSCYPETMITDIKSLSINANCLSLKLIDQFPHSDHFEVLSLWQLE